MSALTNRIDRNAIYYLSIVVVACIFFEFWWLVFYTGHWMYASKKDADYNSREDGGVEGGVKKMVIYINWITFALKVHRPFSLIISFSLAYYGISGNFITIFQIQKRWED